MTQETDRAGELQDVLLQIHDLGREHGQGPVGRFVLAAFLCNEAHSGSITTSDASTLWEAMRQGSGNHQPDVSPDLAHFITLGLNPKINGPDTMQLALERWIAMKRSAPQSRGWECLVAFARLQSVGKRAMTAKQIDALYRQRLAAAANNKTE
jgi:hypothetical protein